MPDPKRDSGQAVLAQQDQAITQTIHSPGPAQDVRDRRLPGLQGVGQPPLPPLYQSCSYVFRRHAGLLVVHKTSQMRSAPNSTSLIVLSSPWVSPSTKLAHVSIRTPHRRPKGPPGARQPPPVPGARAPGPYRRHGRHSAPALLRLVGQTRQTPKERPCRTTTRPST